MRKQQFLKTILSACLVISMVPSTCWGPVVYAEETATETITDHTGNETDGSEENTGSETDGSEEHVHTVVILDALEATCTEDGLTEGSMCSECGEMLTAQEVVPKKGHQITAKVENYKRASCSMEGSYTLIDYCSTCGEEFSRSDVTIEKLPHTWDKGTLDTSRNTMVYKCEKCDATHEVHTHVAKVLPAKKLTCTEDGLTEGSACAYCGEILVKQEIIPKEGHTWDAGVVTKKAAIGVKGVKTFTCISCGQKKTQDIPALTNANTITASSYKKTYASKAQSFTIKASCKSKNKMTFTSNSKYVTVNKTTGKVTIRSKFVGTATITIKSPGTSKYAASSKKITITVNPSKPSLSSVASPEGKKLNIYWNKNTSGSGYQLQYSTNSNFSGAKTKTYTSNKSTSCKLSGLTNNKTYYVRIRTYKKVAGKVYYSAWSSKKSAKVKERTFVYQMLSIK